MEQAVCTQNLEEFLLIPQEARCLAVETWEALKKRAGWLSRPTLNKHYVDASVCREGTYLPEILAEEKRLRDLYGGKGLGILYLESRASELCYSVPPYELIPTSVFDDFMQFNGIKRDEFTPLPVPEQPERRDWKSEAEAELGNCRREPGGAEIKEIYRKHRLEFLAENKRFKNRLRKVQRRNSFQNTLERFKDGSFPPDSEALLQTAFESLRLQMNGRPRPLVLSSSSVMEDDIEHPFKGVYESCFLATTEDPGQDFEAFKDAVKFIFAHIFSHRARSYREEHGLPDEDRMAIVAKHMVGKAERYRCMPEISGVSYQNPYVPDVFFHDMNPGLNTRTVAGEWVYRFSSVETSSGQVSLEGTRRTLEALVDLKVHHFSTWKGRIEEEKTSFLSVPEVYDVESCARDMDEIDRALTEERGQIELEWSAGENGELMVYQCRLMPPVSEVLAPVPMDVSSEDIVMEGVPVLGHGEITLPIIAFSDFESLSGDIDSIARAAGFREYILLGSSDDLEKEIFGSNPAGDSLKGLLPGLRGFIDTGKDTLPLSAHWSEPFISQKILVISAPSLSSDSRTFIERLSKSRPHPYGGGIFITPPLRMAVDVRSRRAVVHAA